MRTRSGDDRRGQYFLFQGLLMAVLLLLFLYQYRNVSDWVQKFSFLLTVLGGSLFFLQTAPAALLSTWGVQIGLFLGDAALATLTLQWTGAQSELYLTYFLIIFGTALIRDLGRSLAVALFTSLLFLFSSWRPSRGFPVDSGFWLKFIFLWITSALLAILARDSQETQKEQEHRFRQRLIEVERLAALGQIAGEVAHRIKAPLTTIMVNAEVLAERLKPSKAALKELAQIQQEVLHCREILKNLLDIGRIEEMDLRAMDLRDPVRSAIRALEPQLKRKAATLEVEGFAKPLPVVGDHSLLHEAFAAVLQNALDAVGTGGRITVTLLPGTENRWWPQGPAASFSIAVEDDGKGIEKENMDRLFKGFFTTKGAEGSGLGLSAALRIFQKHGGTIEAESDGADQGARLTLSIPKAQAAGQRPKG